MHEPTPTALLGGVIGSLESDVLPALEAGAAQRQLKAALVILRRLARAADREALYLDEEAADVIWTLGQVLAPGSDDASSTLARRVAEHAATTPAAGPDLTAARERDTELQTLAIEVEEHVHAVGNAEGAVALRRLHARMLVRQDASWGTAASAK